MHNHETDLITVDELCELLGCGYNSAYKLLNAHKIPAFRIGKNWKIPREGVKKFTDGHEIVKCIVVKDKLVNIVVK